MKATQPAEPSVLCDSTHAHTASRGTLATVYTSKQDGSSGAHSSASLAGEGGSGQPIMHNMHQLQQSTHEITHSTGSSVVQRMAQSEVSQHAGHWRAHR